MTTAEFAAAAEALFNRLNFSPDLRPAALKMILDQPHTQETLRLVEAGYKDQRADLAAPNN